MSVTTWGAGDYPLMAEQLDRAAAAAVDLADVQRGDRLIDVATGTGNAALLAAARGAEVLGVDFEPGLLDVARRRGVDLGLHVRWEAADLAALPVPDEWATVVVSVFGVMYATDHEAAAREMARGTAPNGRIVLASWVPGSFMPAMGQALATFLPPPPPSSGPPSRWGDAAALEAMLATAGLNTLSSSVETLPMTFADCTSAVDFLVHTAGHVIAERDRLTRAGRWDELLTVMRGLVDARAVHRDGQLRIDCEYLLTCARRA